MPTSSQRAGGFLRRVTQTDRLTAEVLQPTDGPDVGPSIRSTEGAHFKKGEQKTTKKDGIRNEMEQIN